MKKIFMLQAVLVLALVFFRPSEAEASVIMFENGTWVEEGEAVFYEVPKETDGISLVSGDDQAYSEYDFEQPYSYYSKDANGNSLKLFTIAVTGTVYFYENGKVHLLRCGAKVLEVIRKSYSVTIFRPQIENTDGSYSEGKILFSTFDEVYACGDFAATAYFVSGSNQIHGELVAVRLWDDDWGR